MDTRPDPDCQICHGDGIFLTHATDCEDPDRCELRGGSRDCEGKLLTCDCHVELAPPKSGVFPVRREDNLSALPF